MANNKKNVTERAINLAQGIVLLSMDNNLRSINSYEGSVDVIVNMSVGVEKAKALRKLGWNGNATTWAWEYKIPRSRL